jgi:type IV pilus assembly protein PilV
MKAQFLNKANAGFTLVEVMVAVLVLAVGLLGLAGLQAASLAANQSAYRRGQASQSVYDLADRMRVNPAGLTNYTAINPATAERKPECSVAQAAPPLPPFPAPDCSPAEMAENDLAEWFTAIESSLPNSLGAVTVNGNVFTVTITWDEDSQNDGDNNNNPTFQTSFQI